MIGCGPFLHALRCTLNDSLPVPVLAADVPWLSLVLVGLGLIVLLVVVRNWRHGALRPVSAPPAASQTLQEVMRDAEELAQRLAAELDAKAERIERLLAEADDVLKRGELRPVVKATTIESRHPRRGPVVTPGEGADPLNRQIYGLADEGLTPVDIAKRLDQPTGKIELILALRGR